MAEKDEKGGQEEKEESRASTSPLRQRLIAAIAANKEAGAADLEAEANTGANLPSKTYHENVGTSDNPIIRQFRQGVFRWSESGKKWMPVDSPSTSGDAKA